MSLGVEVYYHGKDHGVNGANVTVETIIPGERPRGLPHNDENGRRFYYIWLCLPDGSESRVFKSKKVVYTLERERRLRNIVAQNATVSNLTDLELVAVLRDPTPVSKSFFIKPDFSPHALHVTFKHSRKGFTPNNP